ncbi:glutamate 5-kinase [Candidatus Margulisiibacteriota bacterium]
MSRKILAEKSKTIVIKIGTNILTTEDGKLDLNNLRNLAEQISDKILQHKKQILLVSSGAIICGSAHLSLSAKTIPEKQAAASIGQILLMREYLQFFGQKGITIGQILLTKEGLELPALRTNAFNTINKLLSNTTIPIINENDTVATDEIGTRRFGDNDELSFLVAKLIQADMLLMLTDTAGLYTSNPKKSKKAKLISDLSEISDKTFEMIEDTPGKKGRGGMLSKIQNAKKASEAGIPVIIASGYEKNVIHDIFAGKNVGTYIKAQ